MAGIYIHIPFCKKICSYCDFYKTKAIRIIPEYIQAIEKELDIRRNYLDNEIIDTVYIGGGTPSLLSIENINRILDKVLKTQKINPDCEITIEANPDDLKIVFLNDLAKTAVNRISIGIQSFDDTDLKFLNRRHTAGQALISVDNAYAAGFKNISIDLIYGIPGIDKSIWPKNLKTAAKLNIQHISAYHLTIEPGTALSGMLAKGLISVPDEEESINQFGQLSEFAADNNFIHYEISNLAKDGYFSKHNSNYWLQKKYMGVGPSAHSYDLLSRQWNVSDLNRYIKAINSKESFFEWELLNDIQKYNEYILLSLRTRHGVESDLIRQKYGEKFLKHFLVSVDKFIKSDHIRKENSQYFMSNKGWFASDFIISDLFFTDKNGRIIIDTTV